MVQIIDNDAHNTSYPIHLIKIKYGDVKVSTGIFEYNKHVQDGGHLVNPTPNK